MNTALAKNSPVIALDFLFSRFDEKMTHKTLNGDKSLYVVHNKCTFCRERQFRCKCGIFDKKR